MKEKKTKRQRAMTDQQSTQNDKAYLHAFRNGFNKDYTSSRVKFLTREEIAEYKISKKVVCGTD